MIESDTHIDILCQVHNEYQERKHAREEEMQALLAAAEKQKVEKTPVDAFFEICALRVKKLPPAIHSVVEMQSLKSFSTQRIDIYHHNQ